MFWCMDLNVSSMSESLVISLALEYHRSTKFHGYLFSQVKKNCILRLFIFMNWRNFDFSQVSILANWSYFEFSRELIFAVADM